MLYRNLHRNYTMEQTQLEQRRQKAERRIELEWKSQSAFADASGISQSRISRALDKEKTSDRRLAPIERALDELSEDAAVQPAARHGNDVRAIVRFSIGGVVVDTFEVTRKGSDYVPVIDVDVPLGAKIEEKTDANSAVLEG